MKALPLRLLTNLQYLFLLELSTGTKTGKALRAGLRLQEWYGNRILFYRAIRRLKKAGLITARRVPRDPDEYRGSQCEYQLTERGWDAVVQWRELHTYRPDRFTPGKYPRAYDLEEDEEEEWLF